MCNKCLKLLPVINEHGCFRGCIELRIQGILKDFFIIKKFSGIQS